MNTKHTPGPWEINSDNPSKIIVYGLDHKRIALCYKNGKGIYYSENVSRANAQLIASAPELLEALKACVVTLSAFKKYANDYFIERDEKRLQKAIEAIKEAKGE